jgi:hypothetical protein
MNADSLADLRICVISRTEMEPRSRTRIVYALVGAYALVTALHIAWVLHHEPFSFDAWNVAVDTGAKPFSISNFFAYWHQQYTQSNPRLGQPLTYLGYKLEYVAETVLPLCLLALTLAATTLGIGRKAWRDARGMTLWAIAIGCAWFALPQLGRNMFCRAYGLNYLFGATVQLWFLVPLRLVPSRDASMGRCIAYGLFGVAAGMCNEHTGPALVALLLGLAYWHHRQGDKPRLLWAGLAGFLVGFCAIFFAPGQGSRYDGLAQQMSLVDRVIDHGLEGNLIIASDFFLYGAPVLALIVIVVIASQGVTDAERVARRTVALKLIAIAMAVGLTIACTLFVSPKLGARFYFVGLALLLGGFLGLVDAVVACRRWLAPFVVLAVLSSGYAAYRTIPLYAQVGKQGAQRMAELAATPRRGIYVADAFSQIDESWWFIGDDFRDFKKREMVENYFDLAGVFFRGYHPHVPLGLTGVRIVPRYWTTGASCSAEFEGFEFGVRKGFDIAALHASTLRLVDILRAQLAGAELEKFDLPIAFAGERPAMPRPNLILSRWVRGAFEGYTAKLSRKGKSRTRELVPSKPLAASGLELFVVLVGDTFKSLGPASSGALRFEPWGKGVYWALACDADTCWVVAASRM